MELLSIFLLSLLGLLQMNDTTEMVFVGDAMQHGPQIKAAARPEKRIRGTKEKVRL